MKRALVVEGGAMRGVFGSGVLDGFLKARFNPFDLYLGVSAGGTNIAAYLAEAPERNLRVYSDYMCRREFIDPGRYFRGGHLMDLDWLFRVTAAEQPLDLAMIYSRNRPFILGMTDVGTGRPAYIETTRDNLVDALKASSAIPGFYRGFIEINGRPMADGGVADSIPVAEAIRRGASKIMVIRSQVRQYRKRRSLLTWSAFWFFRKTPAFRNALLRRADTYNRQVESLRRSPPGITIIEICPPDGFPVKRTTRDPALIRDGYRMGLDMAPGVIARWDGC